MPFRIVKGLELARQRWFYEKNVTINCVIVAKWWQLQKKQQSATVSARSI